MARKPDIQYVTQFYIHGSEAPAIELEPARRKKKRTAPAVTTRPVEKIQIRWDPMAVCGIVVAVVMVLMMAVGVFQYMDTCARYEAMVDYVIDLQNENVKLERDFRQELDLEQIREKALAMGMIPAEQAEVVIISEYVPVEAEEETLWDEISWFLKGLFA